MYESRRHIPLAIFASVKQTPFHTTPRIDSCHLTAIPGGVHLCLYNLGQEACMATTAILPEQVSRPDKTNIN